jgi:hypothetical protein
VKLGNERITLQVCSAGSCSCWVVLSPQLLFPKERFASRLFALMRQPRKMLMSYSAHAGTQNFHSICRSGGRIDGEMAQGECFRLFHFLRDPSSTTVFSSESANNRPSN